LARIISTSFHTLARRIHRGVVEIDLEAELVAVVRIKPCPLHVGALAFAHFHRLHEAHETLGRALQLDARALQQEHEGRGRAVENRHFLGADVHIQVVDAQARAGRHQVLHRVHLGAAGRDGGGHAGVRHGHGRDGDIHRLGQVHAPEDDARVGLRRTQRQLDPLAPVQTHADGAGQGLEGALLKHPAILRRCPMLVTAM
jgi:hypothetical protein